MSAHQPRTPTLRRLFAAGAVVVAVLPFAMWQASTASASGSSRTFRAIEFNFCGNSCANDSNDREGGGTDAQKTSELEGKITAWQPHLVFLEEVCLAQLEKVQSDLAGGSWPMTAGAATATSTAYDGGTAHVVNNVPIGFTAVDHNRTADPNNDQSDCATSATTGARTFGDAILTRTSASLSNRDDFRINPPDSFNPSGGIQKSLCATVADSPYSTHACVTHTSPGDDALDKHEINTYLLPEAVPYGSGSPLIVGGDFNLVPQADELDATYYAGNDKDGHSPSGIFQEADQCSSPNQRTDHTSTCNEYTHDGSGDGDVTLDRKIDFVFLKQAYFGLNAATSTVNHSNYSDHGITKATMTECSDTGVSGC